MASSQDERIVESHEILCIHCQVSNPGERRFCRNCGQRLWEPCVECGTKNATDVTYCGHCGVNVLDSFKKLTAQIETKLKTADEMRVDGRYYEAMSTLRGVTSKGDSRLEHFVETARSRIEELDELRGQKAGEAETAMDDVRQALASHDYIGAKRIIDEIPVGVHTQEIKESLAEINATVEKIRELTEHIRSGLKAKDYDKLLPYVTELRQLSPHDKELTKLYDQLSQRRDQINLNSAQRGLTKAKELFEKSRYIEAAAMIAELDWRTFPNWGRSD